VGYNGRILGFPFGVGGEYLYVNQTLFQQAGVAEPRKGWTVREFESALPKLTKVDGDGKVTQWAVGYNGSYLSGPAPFYFLDGGSYLTAQGQLNLNQEQVYSRMDWLAEITAKGWARSGWSGPWEAGQMAMAVDWEGRVLQHIKAKTHERYDWRLDYMPVGNAGPFTVLSIHQTVILRQTKHPEEAWTFMKYLYREGEILFGQNMLYPATVTGARAILNKGHETLPPGYDIRRFYAPVLDPPDTGIVYPMNVPGWLEAEGLLNGAWQAVLRGEKPARVAIEEVADQVNNLLADFREKAAIK
jgi:multiple sugar transport system substrate-binding protein